MIEMILLKVPMAPANSSEIPTGECPFSSLTPGMKKSDVIWLSIPFACKVTALEFTDSGLLRQPKLLGFGV